METITLKKSHQNQDAELKYEIDRLKDQLQRAKDDYAKAQEKNKQVTLIASNSCDIKLYDSTLSHPLFPSSK